MTHPIIMPDLGQTAAEGKIVRWLKKPGDQVTQGEALLEVETDKVTMEVESYKSGYLRAILTAEGEMAGALSPIAILTDQADEFYEVRTAESRLDSAQRWSQGTDAKARSATLPLAAGSESTRLAATPAAKSRARELGLDLSQVAASRPDGLITRRDVEAPPARSKPALAMAALTAKSVRSIPHFDVTIDADVSALVEWRYGWNSRHPECRLSLNDIFVRTAALALRDVPGLNVRYADGSVQERRAADVLVIAALPAGLSWVPVSDPTLLTWEDCARRLGQALRAAEQGQALRALGEGTPALAISNLGMFGVKQFTAIIPPDCAAILAIGAVRDEAVVIEGRIAIGKVCTLTLAADHRVIDGVMAAKFLERVQAHLKSL